MNYGLFTMVILAFVWMNLVEQNEAAHPSLCALKKGKCFTTMFVYCEEDGDNPAAPTATATTNLPNCEDVSLGSKEVIDANFVKSGKSLTGELRCEHPSQFVMCATTMHNGKIDGDKITGDKINGDKINGDKINGDKINGDKINGDKIKGDKINGDKIYWYPVHVKYPFSPKNDMENAVGTKLNGGKPATKKI